MASVLSKFGWPLINRWDKSLQWRVLYNPDQTNKLAKGCKGSIVAIVAGTKAEEIIKVLHKIPERQRKKVKEVTLDMAGNMRQIVKWCFPQAVPVIDRFHVQRLAMDALQELRIQHRWQAIEVENEAIEQAKVIQVEYELEVRPNGATVKQLLARSRYVLYKKASDWTESQKQRAELLFERYADVKKSLWISHGLGSYLWKYNR